MQLAWSNVQKSSPLYPKFHNKRYRSVTGYVPFDQLCARLVVLVDTYIDQHGTPAQAIAQSLKEAADSHPPARWLSSELAEAFVRTKLPAKLPKINRALPYLLLLLPKHDALRLPDLGRPQALVITHFLVGDRVGAKTLHSDSIAIFATTDEGKMFFIKADLDAAGQFDPRPATLATAFDEQPPKSITSPTSTEAQNNCLYLAYQCLLYMQRYEPDSLPSGLQATTPGSSANNGFGAIATPTAHHPQRQQKRQQNRAYPPAWIGKDYKPKRQRPSGQRTNKRTQSRQGQSLGTPKDSHWRRGHWRSQPSGPRDNPTYEEIWIEPIHING